MESQPLNAADLVAMRERAATDGQLPLPVFLQFELCIQMARTAEALIEIDGSIMTLLLARAAAATPAPARGEGLDTLPRQAGCRVEEKEI